MLDPNTVGSWADLIDKHGAILIVCIVSLIINIYIVIQLLRGRIVPYSLYKKAVDEADRLQRAMEKEHGMYMTKLLEFMEGLKPHKEGKRNASNRREREFKE